MPEPKNHCFGLFYSEILDAVFRDLRRNGLIPSEERSAGKSVRDIAPPSGTSSGESGKGCEKWGKSAAHSAAGQPAGPGDAGLPLIGPLILRLAEKIHRFDDSVDKYRLSSAEARENVFPSSVTEEIIRDIQATLGIYYEAGMLGRHLDRIEHFFRSEALFLHEKPRMGTIRFMLYAGNCDFALYNEILFQYLAYQFGKSGIKLSRLLQAFFIHYCAFDLYLDHIADTDEDRADGSFNVLLRALDDDGIPSYALHRKLWDDGIYHRLYEMAGTFSGRALHALNTLKEYPAVHALLGRYLEGEIAGLWLFMANGAYTELDAETRQRFTDSDLKPHPWSREPAADLRREAAVINRKIAAERRAVIALGGNCEHGRCRHCSLGRQMMDTTLQEFEQDLAAVDFAKVDTLCLYTAGSFFKRGLDGMRRAVLERVAKTPVKRVMVESRPEAVRPEVLKELADALPGKSIEIGIGLDHLHERYRNQALNKGIRLKDYERAVAAIGEYPPMKSVTYVAAGGPWMTGSQAYKSAVETAVYAIKKGTDIVSFEPVVMQKNTIQEKLFRMGEWEPPGKDMIEKLTLEIAPLARKHGVEIRTGGTVQTR